MRTQLAKGKAGELEYYFEFGPVTAASVALYTSGDSALVASPSASLDSVDETLTASADAEDDTVSVSDTSAIVLDRLYWLQKSTGRGRIVRALDKTASTVQFDQPIGFAVDTSSSLKGHRVSVSLSTSDTATEYRRCEARWTLTVRGSSVYRTTRFDIVERPYELTVTEEHIEEVWPAFGEFTGERASWRKHVAWAKDEIALWIAGHETEPDLAREPEHLNRLAATMVCARMARRTEDVERFERDVQRIQSLLESALWIDADEDLAADDDEIGHNLIRYATVT